MSYRYIILWSQVTAINVMAILFMVSSYSNKLSIISYVVLWSQVSNKLQQAAGTRRSVYYVIYYFVVSSYSNKLSNMSYMWPGMRKPDLCSYTKYIP